MGLTWANVFVNRTLTTLPSRDKINVVLIGHSFGSRLLSTATYSAKAIGAPDCGSADLLIGLQAAFSNARFLGSTGDRDGSAYAISSACKTKAAYTTSKRDTGIVVAPTQLFGSSKYMGGPSTYDREKNLKGDVVFEKGRATPDHGRAFIIKGDEAICDHNDVASEWTSWNIASLINDFANRGARWSLDPAPAIEPCKVRKRRQG